LMVSGDYFNVLGVRAALGRALLPEEERNSARAAVISHNFWQRHFGGDPDIIGRSVTLNNVEVAVVGVAPPRFAGTLIGLGCAIWVPLTVEAQMTPNGTAASGRMRDRGDRWLQAVARLKPGVTLAQANAELQSVARRVSEANGETPPTLARAKWLREQVL